MTLRLLLTGAIVGLIAGAAMAMYAMLASAIFLGQGFFTPMYGIASPLIGPEHMMASMQQQLYFAPVPGLVGLLVHMAWAALYGALFAVVAWSLPLRGAAAIGVGVLYGIAVMAFMTVVILPLVRLGEMPGMVGWPSFTVEHGLYGFVLGLWPVLRPEHFRVAATEQAVRAT
jgi:hypothetical protein